MNDCFCIENYVSNNNPEHHIDLNYKDEGQKEVYEFCKYFMKNNNLNTIIDIGCGSGYKLINILNEFNTIGIETEPCYTYLKINYPDRKWLLSGEIKNSDVVICCDVIEHIVNPDILVDYLISLNTKYYIISTPCREILCNHPKFKIDYGVTVMDFQIINVM
jgi:2-polyprenyl-3-methyl-5-hydroxy-6-metoxy-1,4-benzoquinol methylase